MQQQRPTDRPVLAGLPLLLGAAALAQPSVLPIDPPPGYTDLQPTALSADGRVIVGSMTGSVIHAFRWTAEEGVVDLGVAPGGRYSAATGVNSDGTVIVGWTSTPAAIEVVFRWTPADGMVLAALPSGAERSRATSVSGSGLLTLAWAGSASVQRPYLWDWSHGPAGPLQRWTLTNGLHAVNGDGTAMLVSNGNFAHSDVYRWTASNGLELIHPVMEGWRLTPVAIDSAGRTITGSTETPRGGAGFIWTPEGDSEYMVPSQGGLSIYPTCISGDGRAVGGQCSGPNVATMHAALWTRRLGLADLNALLPLLGATVPPGGLYRVEGLSFDGATMVAWYVANSHYRTALIRNVPTADLCRADLNADLFIDFFDYDGFVEAFTAGRDAADFNYDGFLDFFDYGAFLDAFESGC